MANKKRSKPDAKGKNKNVSRRTRNTGGSGGRNKPPSSQNKAQPPEKPHYEFFANNGSTLSAALGLLLFFLCLFPGKSAWAWLHNVYLGVFGAGAYGIVLLCAAAAVGLSFESVKERAGSFVTGLLAAGAVLLTVWHVLAFSHRGDYLDYTSWGDQIANEFYTERIWLSGGAFGALLGAPLGKLGKAPALAMLGVAMFLLIFLWKSPAAMLKGYREAKRKAAIKKEGKTKQPKARSIKQAAPTEEAGSSPSSQPEAAAGPEVDLSRRDREVLNIFKPKKTQTKKVLITPEPTRAAEPEKEQAYRCPPLSILKEGAREAGSARAEEQELTTARTLIDTLESFGVRASISEVSRGPSVTRYELVPEAGVRINRITNLADDIALRLAAVGVRIEAPIPGKSAIGIEVPNKHKAAVGLREIIDSPVYKRSRSKLNVALGRDISGNVICADLAKMPHLLIAGTTGSGKSVCMNTMIVSLLFNAAPDEVRMLMVDPKQVEFSLYNGVPHLEIPVVTDARKAAGALTWAVGEMEKRYKLLSERGARDIGAYNDLAARAGDFDPITRIVIFIDELSDLMMIAPKEVEDSICRLAQKARAAGIHLVIATQRPSVDVITGLIKANIPSRIALSVSSQVDSRTILDMSGAEKLLGYGDMLFLPVDMQKPVRVQGCYISDAELEHVVRFVSMQSGADYDNNVQAEIEKLSAELGKTKRGGVPEDFGASEGGHDEMFEEAVRVVVEAEMASTTLLQRRLKLGYARASRVIDELEQAGVVGPFEGSRPRKVLISKAQYHERTALGNSFAPPPDEEPPWDD